ncbi:MAG: VOC family protein [Pigmentiphaga sp.]|uniref:VOC family protein n=1 Tax=Pigmentiphaga sp. TaxID=1977564 RepID=UPI0029B95C42|nr:VOC family protein [Pigmentiphaga sp.]MDX3907418.1 VOC family protein [Pigmentiphaga sp.]
MTKVEFRPRRLGHVNLYVSSLQKSLDFYERCCGLARVRMESEINAGFLSNGNTHHDLGLIEISRGKDRHGRDGHVQIRSSRGTQPGLNHLGWEMENQAELVAAYRRMQAAGMAPHALYDHIISHAVYVADPDGNVHEFYADARRDWQSVFNLEHDDLVTAQWDPLGAPPSTEANYTDNPPLRPHRPGEIPTRHVTGASLATRRYDDMVRFMRDVAGFTVLSEQQQPARVAIFGGSTGRPDLRLTEVGPNEPTGFRMFSLLVGPSSAAGTPLSPSPGVSSRQVADHERESLLLSDPDGFMVELYRPRREAFLPPLALSRAA